MKISYQWLQELVDLEGVSVEEVSKKLTLHTAEVEEVESLEQRYLNIHTGKLIETVIHPDTDSLSVGVFDLGTKGTKQIVYANKFGVKIGETLPIALEGAKLQSGVTIGPREVSGVKSEGMACSNEDLGLKAAGYTSFDETTPLGEALSVLITACSDWLIDIDNKSLTHRPDLMGHRGFAIELSAIFRRDLRFKQGEDTSLVCGQESLNISVDSDLCKRFCALKVEELTPGITSSINDQFRLEHLGTKSISRVVDVTNLVLLEYGQPMHVYDADKLEGGLTVRMARLGEKIQALDGNEYELLENDIVVADEKRVVSLGGIIGSVLSGATEDTENIIFESAHWDPVTIRKTSQRLGVRTESSMRYEKTLDPEVNPKVLNRAVDLIDRAMEGGRISSELFDHYESPYPEITIDFEPQMVSALSGLTVSQEEVIETLISLGFGVEKKVEGIIVKVPSNRATKDISLPEDLVEEIVRLKGFNSIPSILPSSTISQPVINREREREWAIRDFLRANAYYETYGYSFVDQKESEYTGHEDFVTISNPLSEEHMFLRQTLIFNVLNKIEPELRNHRKIKLFELGSVFEETKEILPREIEKLLVLDGEMGTKDDDTLYFEQKKEIRKLIEDVFGIDSVSFDASEEVPWYFHPYKSAAIRIEGEIIGFIGCVHPQKTPVKKASIVITEMIMTPIECSINRSYKKLNINPIIKRDLSLIVEEKVYSHQLISQARIVCPEIKTMELFDEFKDEAKIGIGKKNLGFHIEFQVEDTDEKRVDDYMEKIIQVFDLEFQASLRLEFDQNK